MSHHILFPTLNQRTSLHVQVNSLKGIVVFLSIILLSLCVQVNAQDAGSTQPKVLTGHENHHISLKDAATLTRNFRNSTGNDATAITGEFFGRDALVASLDQKNCIGLRIYYGKRDDGTPVLVLVGVDGTGNDMASDLIMEYGILCPPVCGSDNPLTEDGISISGLSDIRLPSEQK